MLVRPLSDDDHSWREEALRRAWGSADVARKGGLVHAGSLPGFVATVDGHPLGLLTYAQRGDEIEIVTIHADQQGRGVGRALMDAALEYARDAGVRRIWLSTTNDNTRAIRFYQQWGMDLAALVRDGVAESRRVKPSIPMIGSDGIPVRHELEFELQLDPRSNAS